MKDIILYGSKYGASRRYAEKLSKQTGIPAISYIEAPNLSSMGTIVYIGSLYAGGVLGLAKTMKDFSLAEGQKLILATVGLSDPKEAETRENISVSLKRQLPAPLIEQAKIFHLRGAINYQTLSLPHRAVMGLLYRSLCKTPAEKLTPENRALTETYGKQVDFLDFSALEPIVQEILNAKN